MVNRGFLTIDLVVKKLQAVVIAENKGWLEIKRKLENGEL